MSFGELHIRTVKALGFIVLCKTDEEDYGFALLCKLYCCGNVLGIFLCLCKGALIALSIGDVCTCSLEKVKGVIHMSGVNL